ncbi:hypothetical protein CSK29544_04219 [Cronobacter sakazakii]|nr:hypothetical protein CSK29544_04219 [Cronobacter sakazakii]
MPGALRLPGLHNLGIYFVGRVSEATPAVFLPEDGLKCRAGKRSAPAVFLPEDDLTCRAGKRSAPAVFLPGSDLTCRAGKRSAPASWEEGAGEGSGAHMEGR